MVRVITNPMTWIQISLFCQKFPDKKKKTFYSTSNLFLFQLNSYSINTNIFHGNALKK